jgi:geranylgeranyl pyrophosphate synthase
MAPRQGRTTMDEAIAVTTGKSGSLGAAICQLGALAAQADKQLQAKYALFGRYLGTIAQLANDIAAVLPSAIGKTDIPLQRPTLPLAYAAALAPSKNRGSLAATDLWSNGATHFTWAVAETYRCRALESIPTLTTDPDQRMALANLLHVL